MNEYNDFRSAVHHRAPIKKACLARSRQASIFLRFIMSNNRGLTALVFVLALPVLAACGNGEPPAATRAMPPPQVGVVKVMPEAIAITTELPGRLEASRLAQVRARAAGVVLERVFREGSEVEAGDVLYRIDPAPLQAALNGARAQLVRAEASLKLARAKADRYAPLVKTNAISRQDYDDAVAARDLAAADVAIARAAVETAQLNLGYATVTAPISGRIGRALVTEGALVGQGEATTLALIQQTDPVYVNLTQSSGELQRLRQAMASGELQQLGPEEARVTLIAEDGREYLQPGRLLFSDITVDESTGAVTLRAEVPNPDRTLLPGMYVRARLEQAVSSQAITVPQQAVLRSQQGSNVMVVGEDGMVELRPVEVGRSHGERWIIRAGLEAGEQVIVDGLQKARPGAPVSAVAWENPLQPGQAASADRAPIAGAASPASQPQAN
jgi:membrane fusion protein (multidrug efflux system)